MKKRLLTCSNAGSQRKCLTIHPLRNIRQRGTVGGSAKKVGRRIVELERIYGIKHGGDRVSDNRANWNNSNLVTQEELAERLGMSKWTMMNYKKLLDMIPELEDLVDTGIVSTTTALAIVRELSPEDQRGSDGLSSKTAERSDDSSWMEKNSSGNGILF